MSGIPYNYTELTVLRSLEFDDWISKQPPQIYRMVLARLDHIEIGHFGNYKQFDGLIEFRWLNGMRIYSFLIDKKIIIVLCGGNKNGQKKDIKKAQKIKKEYLNGTRCI